MGVLIGAGVLVETAVSVGSALLVAVGLVVLVAVGGSVGTVVLVAGMGVLVAKTAVSVPSPSPPRNNAAAPPPPMSINSKGSSHNHFLPPDFLFACAAGWAMGGCWAMVAVGGTIIVSAMGRGAGLETAVFPATSSARTCRKAAAISPAV